MASSRISLRRTFWEACEKARKRFRFNFSKCCVSVSESNVCCYLLRHHRAFGLRKSKMKGDMKGHGDWGLLFFVCARINRWQFSTTNDMALLWNVFCKRSHNAVRQTPSAALRPLCVFFPIFRWIKTHKRIWSGGIMHWKSIEDGFNNGLGTRIDLLVFIFETMHRAWCGHGVMCFCLSSTIALIDFSFLGFSCYDISIPGVEYDD